LRAVAEVARHQGARGLVVDVTAHRARLVELEVAVLQRRNLAERLTREMRRLLVLAGGELHDLELVGGVGLRKRHEDLARTRAHRVTVDLHDPAPITFAAPLGGGPASGCSPHVASPARAARARRWQHTVQVVAPGHVKSRGAPLPHAAGPCDIGAMKTALLFPGQGSQRVGMGRERAQQFAIARQTFEEADDVLGFALSRLCFEGPVDELTLTMHTQPAILATSIAVFRALRERGLAFDVVAG